MPGARNRAAAGIARDITRHDGKLADVESGHIRITVTVEGAADEARDALVRLLPGLNERDRRASERNAVRIRFTTVSVRSCTTRALTDMPGTKASTLITIPSGSRRAIDGADRRPPRPKSASNEVPKTRANASMS